MYDDRKKIVIIGLDGATFDLIKPWIYHGKLPVIGSLMNKGVWGNLRSVIPVISAPAWVSFMTGKNPGKHGIFDFVAYSNMSFMNEEEPSIISTQSVKDKTLWEILSQYGKRVGVVNVPVTYPPKKVNGFLISCFMTPPSAKTFTYPENLKEEIPDYRIDLDFTNDWLFKNANATQKVDKSEMVEDQYDVTEKRALAMLKLYNKYKPDFFIGVFKGTDNMQHYFWDQKDILLQYYQKIDEYIKKILECSGGDTNVFIISDHGFGPEAIKTFYLNTWFEQQGLLKLKNDIRNRSFKLLFFMALKLNKFVQVSSLISPKKTRQVIKASKSQIDWENTVAYAEDKGIKGININISGREPHGVVEKEDYEQIREEIILKLRNLRDPETGEHIIKQVYKKEELYSGTFLDRVSDIVLHVNHKYLISSTISDELFKPIKSIRSGNHSNGYIDGIFIANGPEIKENEHIDGANIIDITPTILHMMGVPVPEDMDGKVLKAIFKEDSESTKRELIYKKGDFEKERFIKKIKDIKKNNVL